MKIKFSLALLLFVAVARNVSAETQLISNGGFEIGLSSWTVAGSAGASVVTNSAAAHAGSSAYLSLGNVSGAGQAVYQTITIPTNAIYPTLTYFWSVISAD